VALPRLALGLVAAIGLALGVAACSPSGSGHGGIGAGGEPVATNTVDLPPSYRFAPAAIAITAGTTVTWTNHDNFTHSVQLDGTAAPGQVMHPGEQTTHTFATPGTYHYVCSFHANNMQGEVIVTS
jgi:plastocyanin